MKLAFIAIALAAVTSAQAGSLPSSGSTTSFLSGKSGGASSVFEAANRKGSHRVGGSGRSGKGGRYVGGRR